MKKILFFGDSITDALRDRESTTASQFGFGYVMQIAGKLFEKSPVEYNVVNKGISGNKVSDLLARLDKDFLSINADMVLL